MKYTDFDQLEKAYCEYSDKDKYPEAIKILEEGLNTLPEKELKDNYYRIMTERCWLYCNDDRIDDAINAFSELILNGYISPIDWTFDDLQAHPKYKDLVKKNEQLKIDVQNNTSFDYKVHLPKEYTPEKSYPLFLSFHGDGENQKNHDKHWNPEWLTEKGFIVVSPQSSRVHYHDGFIWIDSGFYAESYETRKYPYVYSNMHQEVSNCFESLKKEYSIDEENIILGGFSGGSVAALDILMSHVIPAKGAIPLCSLKPKSFTKENLVSASSRGIKIVFMDGEEDLPSEHVDEMVQELNSHNISNQQFVNNGIGHWYPNDLQSKLEKAISFILK